MRALIDQRLCPYCGEIKDMSDYESKLDYVCRECLPRYRERRQFDLEKRRRSLKRFWTRLRPRPE